MTLELLEGAVDAVSEYLQANMADKVAALNARYDDHVVLGDIVKYYTGGLPFSTPEVPSLVVHGEGWTPRLQRRVNIEASNEMTIIVFVGADDLDVRFRSLCRYAIGVVELLNTAEPSLGYVVNIRGQVALSDSLDTQPFLQAITIPVSLEKAEVY